MCRSMRRSKRRLIVAAALVVTLFGLGTQHNSAEAAPELVLSVELDGREYTIGQPVLAMISIKNVGDAAFRDLTILDPAAGFLRLRLLRDGFSLPWTGRREHLGFGGEGIALRP